MFSWLLVKLRFLLNLLFELLIFYVPIHILCFFRVRLHLVIYRSFHVWREIHFGDGQCKRFFSVVCIFLHCGVFPLIWNQGGLNMMPSNRKPNSTVWHELTYYLTYQIFSGEAAAGIESHTVGSVRAHIPALSRHLLIFSLEAAIVLAMESVIQEKTRRNNIRWSLLMAHSSNLPLPMHRGSKIKGTNSICHRELSRFLCSQVSLYVFIWAHASKASQFKGVFQLIHIHFLPFT